MNSSANSSAGLPTDAAIDLHPTLQSALSSLDVELEEELIRFRRQRRKLGQEPPYRSTPVSPISFDLPASSRAGQATDSTKSSSPTSSYLTPPHPATATSVAHPVTPPSLIPPSPAPSNYEQLELASWKTPDASVPPATATADRPPEPVAAAPFVADSSESDYLASSEELLRSIAEETELRQEQETNLLDSLLTPLGVGSMLLLLLSSATLGYVLMNPASLDFMVGMVRPGARSGETSETAISPDSAQNSSQTPTGTSSDRPFPDLATKELVDVNLDTLSRIAERSGARGAASLTAPKPPQPQVQQRTTNSEQLATVFREPAPELPPAAPAPPPKPPAPAVSYAPIPPAPVYAPEPVPVYQSEPMDAPEPEPAPAYQPPPAPEPYYPPEPSPAASDYLPPAPLPPEPEVSQMAPAAPAAPAAPTDDRYYVVTPYTGDPSLAQAREAVGDAYVRNFEDGAQVQMGSYTNANEAREEVQRLLEQGIPAEIYQP